MQSLRYSILILLFFNLLPAKTEARFRHGGPYYGGRFYAANWRQGYWFHGTYMGRAGWWWIVGPGWYYYPSPLYPYPPSDAQPVYVVQVPNAPPPPPAPAPNAPATASPTGTVTTTGAVAAPPGGASAASAGGGKGQAFTYYCDKSKGYYPNISTCADGWVATPVKAPN